MGVGFAETAWKNIDRDKYAEGWERVFGKKDLKLDKNYEENCLEIDKNKDGHSSSFESPISIPEPGSSGNSSLPESNASAITDPI